MKLKQFREFFEIILKLFCFSFISIVLDSFIVAKSTKVKVVVFFGTRLQRDTNTTLSFDPRIAVSEREICCAIRST